MPVSAAKKAANLRWDKKNMSTVACKLKKEQADAFKEYAFIQGKTVNTLLREYVFKCIGYEEE